MHINTNTVTECDSNSYTHRTISTVPTSSGFDSKVLIDGKHNVQSKTPNTNRWVFKTVITYTTKADPNTFLTLSDLKVN